MTRFSQDVLWFLWFPSGSLGENDQSDGVRHKQVIAQGKEEGPPKKPKRTKKTCQRGKTIHYFEENNRPELFDRKLDEIRDI